MSRVPSLLWLFGRYELLLAVRSRWLQIFAAVFALLALAVSGSGYILSGGYGVQDFRAPPCHSCRSCCCWCRWPHWSLAALR